MRVKFFTIMFFVILLMTLSVVSAGFHWGTTGNVIKSGDEINIYDGDENEFEFGGKNYEIVYVKITQDKIEFSFRSLNNDYSELASLFSGEEFISIEGLKITLLYIDEQWWRKVYFKNPYRARLKITESEKCIDSDGGKDYYKKGEVKLTRKGMTITDACIGDMIDYESPNPRYDPEASLDAFVEAGTITESQKSNRNILIESFCPLEIQEDSWKNPFLFTTSYECPNGCEDGACVESTDTGTEINYDNFLEVLSNSIVVGFSGTSTCQERCQIEDKTCILAMTKIISNYDTLTSWKDYNVNHKNVQLVGCSEEVWAVPLDDVSLKGDYRTIDCLCA